jgi:hypothetical protein
MKITTSYNIIKEILNFPAVPSRHKLFDGRRYQLAENGFTLTVSRRGSTGKNVYHLYINNKAGKRPLPENFDATGLLPKLAYEVMKRRRMREIWSNILPDLSTVCEKQRKLYNKLKKSEGNTIVSVSSTPVAKEFGGGIICVTTAECVLDGQTVIAQKCDSNCADRPVYSTSVNDASFSGKYAKKIYLESFSRRQK